MRKPAESKLDQHAEPLMQMEAEHKTLDEMMAWLRQEGVTCSPSTLSRFLTGRRTAAAQEDLLARIASGARQVKLVEEQFGKDPAPELETLIKLHRVLILKMSMEGQADLDQLKISDQLLRTAMEFQSARTKAAQKEKELAMSERRLELLEKKAAAYDRAQAAIDAAKTSKGGITKDTLRKIEQELNLL